MPVAPKRATLAGLSLRDYQEYPRLSEETIAFSGVVYDEATGVSLGELTNRGDGGAHRFSGRDRESQQKWETAWERFAPIQTALDDGPTFLSHLDEALANLSGEVLASKVARQGTTTKARFLAAAPEEIVAQCGAVPVATLSMPDGGRGMALWEACWRDMVTDGYTLVYAETPRSRPGLDVFVIAPE